MKKNDFEKMKNAALIYVREKSLHLTEDEVFEAIKLAVEGAFDKHRKKVIFDVDDMSVIELTENGIMKRELKWLFGFIDKRVLFYSIEAHLDRYEREKVFSMFRPSKGQVIKAEAVGETYHLGVKGREVVQLRWGYAGSIADFGKQYGIYVEGGKDDFLRIPAKDWSLWNLAKEIYEQTGYCMSINPTKKNMRLKKQSPAVIFNVNGVDSIMPSDERVKGEEYEGGEWEVILYDVNQTCREDFQLYVSRRQIEFLVRYLYHYIPDFKSLVKVKKVAREPGVMAKILIEKIEPRFRVSKYADAFFKISEQLNGEKIEIVENGGDAEDFLKSALNFEGSLKIDTANKEAVIITEKKGQVIGAKGVNVRLAGMLTEYKITVLTMDEYINDTRIFSKT